jgi:hypothetical protein
MTSKVTICNMALSRIGADTITALTDDTEPARLCNTFFNELADRVMMQGAWSSTVRRVGLAQTTNTPSFEFDNEFQLPVDPKCLRVLSVNETDPGNIDYAIEDDKLLTDESSIKIKYIARLTDTADWDPMLIEAFEVLLASYLAIPIMGDKVAARELRQEYFRLTKHNLSLNNQQSSKPLLRLNEGDSAR